MWASKTEGGDRAAFLCVNTSPQRVHSCKKNKQPFKKTESGDQFIKQGLVVAMGMKLQTGFEESIIMPPNLQNSLMS